MAEKEGSFVFIAGIVLSKMTTAEMHVDDLPTHAKVSLGMDTEMASVSGVSVAIGKDDDFEEF